MRHLAEVSTLPESLLRVYSGVIRAARSVPWSGEPAGDGRSSCSRDFLGGSEPPRIVAFTGGSWEKRSLETTVPWSTGGGRVDRPISWGHWGEMGTVWWGVHRSSPEGPALRSPEPWETGLSLAEVSIENDGPQTRHLLRRLRLTQPEPARAGPEEIHFAGAPIPPGDPLKPHSHCTLVPENCQRKLPECLLCERKHVPGLIPGLIPGWDLVTLPGSVPERALCEQKPDQCRKGCVVVMTHFIVRQFYRVFWRQINFHTRWKMCKLEWSSDQGAPHYPRWSWNHSPV